MSPKPVVAVFDKKLALYEMPFTVRHIGEAVREFSDLKKNPETRFGKHPEDFDLFQIAKYSEVTGTFEPCTPPLHLDSGV